LEVDARAAKFDWALLATEVPEGMRFRIEYASELFTPETVKGFGKHFGLLLRNILENPNQPFIRVSPLRFRRPKASP
jgi:non-ribosomal peptide synthetase component F